MNLARALTIARSLLDDLAPACQQIEIAGSIRRAKPDVHDIELVAQPRLAPSVTNFFGEVIEDYSLLDDKLTDLVEAGRLLPGAKNGTRFKQFRVPPDDVILDLFIVLPPAQWGYIMAIRTGPAHYSQWLVTPRRRGGAMPSNLTARDGAYWHNDQVIETPTEAAIYQVLGIPMPQPADRHPLWGLDPSDIAGPDPISDKNLRHPVILPLRDPGATP